MKLTGITLFIFIFMPLGCTSISSGHNVFYKSLIRADFDGVDGEYEFLDKNQDPVVIKGENYKDDINNMINNGFWPIGYSYFNGKLERVEDVIKQAKKVKATHVLIYTKYTDTIKGVYPITQYNQGEYATSYFSGHLNGPINGYGSFSNLDVGYSGSSTTYLPGTSTTTYIPYEIERYDQSSLYWAKKKYWKFGASFTDLPEDIMNSTKVKTGCLIVNVVKNTPAHKIELLPGDIIVKVNDIDVLNSSNFNNIIDKHRFGFLKLTLFREKRFLTKIIFLK